MELLRCRGAAGAEEVQRKCSMSRCRAGGRRN